MWVSNLHLSLSVVVLELAIKADYLSFRKFKEIIDSFEYDSHCTDPWALLKSALNDFILLTSRWHWLVGSFSLYTGTSFHDGWSWNCRQYLVPTEMLPFHEIICFKCVSSLKQVHVSHTPVLEQLSSLCKCQCHGLVLLKLPVDLVRNLFPPFVATHNDLIDFQAMTGATRQKVQLDLLGAQLRLQCQCCHPDGSLSNSMHDTSLAYVHSLLVYQLPSSFWLAMTGMAHRSLSLVIENI